MARFLWLLGTIVVGAAIAVGSWFGVREISRTVQAAAPGDGPVVAQNRAAGQSQPGPRPPARATNNRNFNDNEAPPDNSASEPPKTFIGALRDSLDSASDLDMDKDQYLKSLDAAELEFQKIKQQNRAALEGLKRRPPISVAQSPNFIVIDMPGLGFADLATFSQDANPDLKLDELAAAGLVFTHYYSASASPVANSCSILTGLHSGRTRMRGNEPVIPLALDDVTAAEVLWRAGYATAMVGEWRLGGADSSGAPMRQGFGEAWYTSTSDGEVKPVVWNGDRRVADDQQPADLTELRTASIDQALSFIGRHRTQPVFLYLSMPIDGADADDALGQVDQQIARLTKAVNEMRLVRETYFMLVGSPGENLPPSAAPPRPEPLEAVPAPDEPVEVAKAPPAIPLREEPAQQLPAAIIPGAKAPALRPEPSNKVIEIDLTSSATDSGTSEEESVPAEVVIDNAYIEQLKHREPLQTRTAREVAGLRGELGEMYEGGLRAPLIVWTSRRLLGGVRNEVVAAWDVLPTLASLSYAQFIPSYINGESFATYLQINGEAASTRLHMALYWESHGDTFNRAFLYGKWKLIQIGEDGPLELYNLDLDPQETRNVADQQSERVEKLKPLLDMVRSKSRHWPRANEPAE